MLPVVLADFLGSPWRPTNMAADALHMTAYSSQCVGTQRTAPYMEVWDFTLEWAPPKQCHPKPKHPSKPS